MPSDYGHLHSVRVRWSCLKGFEEEVLSRCFTTQFLVPAMATYATCRENYHDPTEQAPRV
jgi:hypothetical protein